VHEPKTVDNAALRERKSAVGAKSEGSPGLIWAVSVTTSIGTLGSTSVPSGKPLERLSLGDISDA